ncbi:uncharacterized protein F5891DRAFT_979693 [Suillus fuscotomentosus]|uniref:Uncharacterized protein n=1 Tax=Suillus fuscotomentosus TaxID=1912939 RepID=A0AAD4EA25_9AGAM|nr:uncharacterized protein F5891DRAFT_979693 [Suillus fuscotomentosus]KAG1901143.1 hypothetical protein F5891DRAFT_979693 [Suillus fuscotomentosus]
MIMNQSAKPNICKQAHTSKEHDDLCTEAVESIARQLSTAEPDLLVARTTVLAQFARLAPDAFKLKSNILMALLVKKLLMVPSPADPVHGAIILCTKDDNLLICDAVG